MATEQESAAALDAPAAPASSDKALAHATAAAAASLPSATGAGALDHGGGEGQQQQEEADGRPRLTAVETQRVTTVLQDIIKKLRFLGDVPSSSSSSGAPQNELIKFVREEVGRHLQEQQKLEARHRHLVRQWDELVAQQENALEGEGGGDNHGIIIVSNSSHMKAALRAQDLHAELQATMQAIAQNASRVLWQLKENPRVSGFALKVERERKELARLLEGAIPELHATDGGFALLVAKVEEERRAQEQLTIVLQQEKQTFEAVVKIEQDLRVGGDAHKEQVQEQQAAIARLQADLDAARYANQVEVGYARREARAKAAAARRVCLQEQRDLERQLARLRAQREVERRAHEELAGFLRGKHQETVAQLERWKAKAAEDLGALDTAQQEAADSREAAREELERLRARKREEAVAEAARQEADRLRDLEERREALAARARGRAGAKIKAVVATFALARKAAREEAAAAAKAASPKGGKKGAKKKDAAGAAKPGSAGKPAAAAAAGATKAAAKKK